MPENPSLNNVPVPQDLSRESGAKPIPPSVLHQLQANFGQDLSDVRVHEGHAATLMQARSFTRGNDIFFAPGEYQPHSENGSRLLAHELTHVVQQSSPTPSPSAQAAGDQE